jgi:MFS family permease
MSKTTFLWIPIAGNVVAVCLIPFVGSLSDRVGRRPVMIVGILGAGALMPVYLTAISQQNDAFALLIAVLMWGGLYQGYNAVWPSFFPELFSTRTRVTSVAIATQTGFALTGFVPTLEGWIAPPGGDVSIPLVVGGLVFGLCCIAAAAVWTAREPFRIPLERLGEPGAEPLSKSDYEAARVVRA